MKRIRRHIARTVAGCLCTLLLLPHVGLAEAEEAIPEGSGLAEIALQAQSVEERDPFAPEEGFLLTAQESRPPHFDLRNADGASFVTPVRQQNPFGTCWGLWRHRSGGVEHPELGTRKRPPVSRPLGKADRLVQCHVA